jgi:CheY-like chemotaxis protein
MKTTDRCLLVVDDDLSVVWMLSAFLADEGFTVRTAANGVEALECVAAERPEMILLDMGMPVMDGWSFARELQARHWDVPLIVMTAAKDARRSAEAIGAATYVAKPVNLPQLLARIQQVRPC